MAAAVCSCKTKRQRPCHSPLATTLSGPSLVSGQVQVDPPPMGTSGPHRPHPASASSGQPAGSGVRLGPAWNRAPGLGSTSQPGCGLRPNPAIFARRARRHGGQCPPPVSCSCATCSICAVRHGGHAAQIPAPGSFELPVPPVKLGSTRRLRDAGGGLREADPSSASRPPAPCLPACPPSLLLSVLPSLCFTEIKFTYHKFTF